MFNCHVNQRNERTQKQTDHIIRNFVMPVEVNLLDFILKMTTEWPIDLVLLLGSQLILLITLDYISWKWRRLIKNCHYYTLRPAMQFVLKYQANSGADPWLLEAERDESRIRWPSPEICFSFWSTDLQKKKKKWNGFRMKHLCRALFLPSNLGYDAKWGMLTWCIIPKRTKHFETDVTLDFSLTWWLKSSCLLHIISQHSSSSLVLCNPESVITLEMDKQKELYEDPLGYREKKTVTQLS